MGFAHGHRTPHGAAGALYAISADPYACPFDISKGEGVSGFDVGMMGEVLFSWCTGIERLRAIARRFVAGAIDWDEIVAQDDLCGGIQDWYTRKRDAFVYQFGAAEVLPGAMFHAVDKGVLQVGEPGNLFSYYMPGDEQRIADDVASALSAELLWPQPPDWVRVTREWKTLPTAHFSTCLLIDPGHDIYDVYELFRTRIPNLTGD